LIIYIPNSEYSFKSNTSTFKMSYTDKERLEMIQNGFEVITYNNLTGSSNYDYCISPAILRRSQERLGLETTDECNQCFSDFCWDGTYNHTKIPSWDAIDESSSSNITFQTSSPSSTSSTSSSTSKSKNDAFAMSSNWLITSIAIFVATIFG
jgi:lysophospholipase